MFGAGLIVILMIANSIIIVYPYRVVHSGIITCSMLCVAKSLIVTFPSRLNGGEIELNLLPQSVKKASAALASGSQEQEM